MHDTDSVHVFNAHSFLGNLLSAGDTKGEKIFFLSRSMSQVRAMDIKEEF